MDLCRLCFDICGISTRLEGELEDMLKYCISEIDLDLTKSKVLCKKCEGDLRTSYSLKKKGLQTQQKILIIRKRWLRQSSSFANVRNSENSEGIENENLSNPGPIYQQNDENNDNLEFSEHCGKVNLVTSTPLLDRRKQKRIDCSTLEINPDNNNTNNSFLENNEVSNENSADISNKITEKPQYKCDKCPYVTKCKRWLKKHRLKCTKERVLKPPKKTKFVCKVCSESRNSREGFSNHMLKKHNIVLKLFKCEYCKFSATTLDKLKDHEYIIHSRSNQSSENQTKSLIKCTVEGCNRQFLTKTGWQHHINSNYHSNSPGLSGEYEDLSAVEEPREGNSAEVIDTPEPIDVDNIQPTPRINIEDEIIFLPEGNLDVFTTPPHNTDSTDNPLFLSPRSDLTENFMSAESDIEEGSESERIMANKTEKPDTLSWDWPAGCGEILYSFGEMQPEGEIWK